MRPGEASSTVTPASLARPHTNQPFMELEQIIGNVCSDDQADMESNTDDYARDINDSDEGIESEDGEDIDGEAFKQLIRWVRTHCDLWENLSWIFAGRMFPSRTCLPNLLWSTPTA